MPIRTGTGSTAEYSVVSAGASTTSSKDVPGSAATLRLSRHVQGAGRQEHDGPSRVSTATSQLPVELARSTSTGTRL